MPRTKGAKDLAPRRRRPEAPLVIEHEPEPEVLAKRRPIKAWHQTAIHMYAKGKTKVDIALELHKTVDAVTDAIRRYPEVVDQAVRELANPEKMFLPMLPKAAGVYHQILDRDTKEADAATLRVQQSVAGDIMDRTYGRPVQRNINEGHHEIVIKFEDASDSEAAQKNQETIIAQLSGPADD